MELKLDGLAKIMPLKMAQRIWSAASSMAGAQNFELNILKSLDLAIWTQCICLDMAMVDLGANPRLQKHRDLFHFPDFIRRFLANKSAIDVLGDDFAESYFSGV